MIKINKEVVALFLLVILAIWVIYPFFENFDVTGTEFVSEGSDRYGLRGDLLRRSSIKKYFIRPDRNIRLSHSTGEMWESNNPPGMEGVKDCVKVPCPSNDGYDGLDTCWKCGNQCREKMPMPDIWPHVKN
ncbi:hypothetical protein QKU48_gp0869 [Fadolivirus algeromassiliense]|jgi:hypothetical protein|uniref:Uncharacterized protein n=1 Tax=Fadolivirus FV1/VV64 TaxID=3070911 RepID=A0A7D3QUP4_9VIRU|nr:hypothetical protein QKU48_gp0869 [Fadolivirus algeromassiliense]QKF94327.1 hypothetical protein Fadolivirus_1_869 [Fadolivirus FV1/VV64]